MKSLMSLSKEVLADASIWCRTSTTLDFNTIERRCEHEGLSFLTITLPEFCKDFERSLDQGSVDSTMFTSFRRRGSLPQFLGGLTSLVFDRESGRLLDTPCLDAIRFIRQITLMYKKILLPCSLSRTKKAFDKYVECENEVSDWSSTVSEHDINRFGRVADLLWARDLSLIDRKVYELGHQPKHGPGATADRISGNRKFEIRRWYTRFGEYFPAEEFAVANYGYGNELGSIDFIEPEDEIPVRVISVPKTLKTPRIIAIEPAHVQYVQQSMLEMLVETIESSEFLRGALGFTDQEPNQRLACLGSEGKGLATLDLSEASDRVSNLLVLRMLKNWPHLSGAIQASRSTRADVPGYGVLSLTKFASMGSATCFPIEAMVFLTIVAVAKEKQLRRPLRVRDLTALCSRVRIYGDDIIIPVDLVQEVTETLTLYGLKVNSHKSFWTGKFRESCGKDYYDGCDVTVTYVRNLFPTSPRDASEMISLVSLRNQLYKAGCWTTTEYLDNVIGGLAPFPTVAETSPVFGRHSFLGYETQRMCKRLHRPLVRGLVLRTKHRKSLLDGHGALLKFFLKRGDSPNPDAKHLERHGRPDHVDTKVRWASAA